MKENRKLVVKWTMEKATDLMSIISADIERDLINHMIKELMGPDVGDRLPKLDGEE